MNEGKRKNNGKKAVIMLFISGTLGLFLAKKKCRIKNI